RAPTGRPCTGRGRGVDGMQACGLSKPDWSRSARRSYSCTSRPRRSRRAPATDDAPHTRPSRPSAGFDGGAERPVRPPPAAAARSSGPGNYAGTGGPDLRERVDRPHPVVDPALPVADPAEALLPPVGVPAVLGQPGLPVVVVADDADRMKALRVPGLVAVH